MIAGFYTYIHLRADDGLVFYVGKGRGNRARTTRGRNEHWHRTVAKHGLVVKIVGEWASEKDAFAHERSLISLYRAQGCPLCNKTDGGEGMAGYRFSEESRAKIRAAHIGMTPSQEARAKIGAANKGRVRTDEFRAKVSAGLKGRPVSAETREKISAAQRGRNVDAARRAKIAASLRGRRLSDEDKARLLPLTHSAESRAKHSAKMKGRPWSAARREAQNRRQSRLPGHWKFSSWRTSRAFSRT